MIVDPRIGTRLAGYRIEALLGRGGMSVVYRAEQARPRRYVALKLLSPGLAENDAFRQRFLRESELAAATDHPNILPVYDAGEAGGVLYIAMRYVEGVDLKVLLAREGRLEPGRALAIAGQVAGALDAAHTLGLVHRDVKPGNILLAAGGTAGGEHAYLADFGLTKRPTPPASSASPGRSSAPSTTSPPSRSRANGSTAGPTSTRSPACCSSALPVRCRSPGRRSWPCSGRTCSSPRRDSAPSPRTCRRGSTRPSPGRSPSHLATGSRPAGSWSPR